MNRPRLWGGKQTSLRQQQLETHMTISRCVWSQLARDAVNAKLRTTDEIRAMVAGERELRARALCQVRVHSGHLRKKPDEASVTMLTRSPRQKTPEEATAAMLNILAAKSLTNRALEIMGITKTSDATRMLYERLAVARLGEGATPAELMLVVEWGRRQKNLNARRIKVIWGKDWVEWMAIAKQPNPISAVSDPRDRAALERDLLEEAASRGLLRRSKN